MIQSGRFTRCADRHNRIRTLAHVMLYQPFQSRPIYRAIAVHRCDHRNHASCQHTVSRRWLKACWRHWARVMLLSWPRHDKNPEIIAVGGNAWNGSHETARAAYTFPGQAFGLLRWFRNFSTTCTSLSWYPSRR